MKVEIRADDSVHIEGYVNVCERESRPVATPYGKVNEVIAEGTFQRAVDSAEEVGLMVDHERLIGSTKTGLELSEDAIGLRAELDTSDEEVVEAAKAGKIKGWSFGFRKSGRNVSPSWQTAWPRLYLTPCRLSSIGRATVS